MKSGENLQIQMLPTERQLMGCMLVQPQRQLALCPAELLGMISFIGGGLTWKAGTHYVRNILFCLDKNIYPTLGYKL